MNRAVRLAAVGLAAAVAMSGCGGTGNDAAGSAPAGASGSLMVFAAASLKQSFTEIGDRFSAENAGTTVEFNFAGSSDLVTQLTQGASADVFASADVKNMDKAAAQAGLVAGAPVDFASNVLTIAVAPGNPKGVSSFRDLAKPDLAVVTCAPQVPCGAATRRIEQATDVTLSPVSEESSVTDVLNKVSTGQADAGLVYVTDAAGSGGKVDAVAFPESAGAVNTYPIAALKESKNADLAKRFVDYVTGATGQQVLGKAGFGKP